jgi:hypothetical protein
MNTRIVDLAALTVTRAAFAGSLTLFLVTPASANQWAAEAPIGLNGTTLTYFPYPDQGACHQYCVNNGNCKGATWIQAGTYRRQDPAMCYLLSAVTSRFTMRGHVSMVKTTGGTGPGPTAPSTNLTGRWSWTAKCPEQDYVGAFQISSLGAGGSFGGGFENGGGNLSGRVVGNRMEFLRTVSGLQQRWAAVASPNRMDGGLERPTERKPNCAFYALRG